MVDDPYREKALKNFVNRVNEVLGDNIVSLHLFGSYAKGTAKPESDIDVLVVYQGSTRDMILDSISEIAFDIMSNTGRLIQTVIMTKEEFERGVGTSPFLWEVLVNGRVLYSSASGTEWKLDFKEYLRLAEEYLSYAKDAYEEDKIRLAIDSGYNAVELLIKALIVSTGTSLASSHSGVIQQFGELFIKIGKIERELGKSTHKALTLRGQARYVPTAELKKDDAKLVISLGMRMLEIAKRELR